MKKIAVIIYCHAPASETPCCNIARIIKECSYDSFIITVLNKNSKRFCDYSNFYEDVVYTPNTNTFKDIWRYFIVQIRLIIKILRVLKYRYNEWFIFMGETTILSILFLKILRKKVTLILGGSISNDLSFNNKRINSFLLLFSKFSFKIIDRIVIYSSCLIKEWHLDAYNDKILIAHRHFLDFNTFKYLNPYSERTLLIGYIGRISSEKGIQHFIEAIPIILNNQKNLNVVIGGEGHLKEAIETSIHKMGINSRIYLPGWISHDDLPKFLNQLRLLVIPSYTEGLPNIMLEAMACGTPVLATPVGAIPDVIQDGETGFIMEDNSPECVARNVLRALSDPDLEGVAERGRRFVEGEFTFEKAVERWRLLIEEIV